jgi:MFS family permease
MEHGTRGAHPTPSGTGLWSPLRLRPFATLVVGYAVSAVGNGMSSVTISWLAISLARGHDTGLLVGLAIASYTLPGVVVGLGLGRILSRIDPRLMVVADAGLKAVCLGTIAILALLGILAPAAYVGLLAFASLLGLLGSAGDLGSVSELLPANQLVAGNSLVSMASFGGIIIGPALAGFVIAATSPAAAIGADAASFAILVLAASVSRRVRPPDPLPGGDQSVFRAFRTLVQTPALLGITLLCVVFFGLYGPVEVALPVFVADKLHAGAGILGGFWTLFAVGATVGALGAAWVQRFGMARVALVVTAGWGVCLLPFGFTDSVTVGFIALGVGGLIYGPFVPLKRSIMQRYSPPGSLSAIAAASGMLTVTATPVGTALGGPLVAAIGPSATLFASGVLTIAAAVVGTVALVLLRRGTR